MTHSTKIREPKASRIARRSGVPDAQVANDEFAVVEVKDVSQQDSRDKGRSGVKETVRRLTRIERLVKLGIIDKDQAKACQWYSDAHELGFIASLGCTANYGGTGTGGGTDFDLFARHKAQQEARDNYLFAKLAIPIELLNLFEATIFGNLGENEFRGVTRNEQFRIGLAAWRLHEQVSHLIEIGG